MPLLIAFIGTLAASLVVNVFMERLTGPIIIVEKLLKLSLTHNPHIAFSIALPAILQNILIGCALGLVMMLAYRTRDQFARVAYGLILGGAIGNIIDRLSDGTVTDYVSVGTFPVFNMADICITIGAGLLILEGVKRKGS